MGLLLGQEFVFFIEDQVIFMKVEKNYQSPDLGIFNMKMHANDKTYEKW